jgi:hypothetical protein
VVSLPLAPTESVILPADDSKELPVEIRTDPLAIEDDDELFKETSPVPPVRLAPLDIATIPLVPSIEEPLPSSKEPPSPDPNNEDPAVKEMNPPFPVVDEPPSNDRAPTSEIFALSATEISMDPLLPEEPRPLRIDTSPPNDPDPPKRAIDPPSPSRATLSPPRMKTSAPFTSLMLDPPKMVTSPAVPVALSPDMILTLPLLWSELPLPITNDPLKLDPKPEMMLISPPRPSEVRADPLCMLNDPP